MLRRAIHCEKPIVRAKLAKWVDISDVALLKRLRNGEEWLRSLCIELFRPNGVARLEGAGTVPGPNRGWHDCARARQDGQSMADSV